MAKKERSLVKLTKVCNEVLKVSKKYSYLWDDEEIWKKSEDDKYSEKNLYIAWGFIAQDETFSIYITRVGDKFAFYGKNFCNNDEKNRLSARVAALRIKNWYGNYVGMDADNLKEDFYSSLKKVLGKYLGKKGLEKIKF